MERVGTTLGLAYLTPEEFDARGAHYSGRLLGVIGFGARPRAAPVECPFAWIELPVVHGEAVYEVWTSKQPVVCEVTGGIATARNEDLLFGCLQANGDVRLDNITRDAYCSIFDLLDARGYGHLLRVWHYFPQINADADGLERYRQFNVGRHEAFLAKGRVIPGHAPAACALGSRSGPLVVYFLAARRAGRAIANPRQVDPYRYPPQYGPRRPAFSRAILAEAGGEPVLFISGTASIVGHETLHAGDAAAQAGETAANLRTVLEQVRLEGTDFAGPSARIFLKAYLRDPDDLPALRERLTQSLGPRTGVTYLQADICRSDLHVEVEGVCLTRTNA